MFKKVLSALRDAFSGTYEAEIPEEACLVSVRSIARNLDKTGDQPWSGYQLLGFTRDHLSYEPAAYGEKVLIIDDIEYLEKGEGDEPTIYINIVGDPIGTYPADLDWQVVLMDAPEVKATK